MQCQKLKTYMESGRVIFLPPKLLRANPTQPRQVFDREALDAASAKGNRDENEKKQTAGK